jgi:hypothetical protein
MRYLEQRAARPSIVALGSTLAPKPGGLTNSSNSQYERARTSTAYRHHTLLGMSSCRADASIRAQRPGGCRDDGAVACEGHGEASEPEC